MESDPASTALQRCAIPRETTAYASFASRETVIERPAVTREMIVAAPFSCSLGGATYASGSLSCQAGYQYRCSSGAWERVGIC